MDEGSSGEEGIDLLREIYLIPLGMFAAGSFLLALCYRLLHRSTPLALGLGGLGVSLSVAAAVVHRGRRKRLLALADELASSDRPYVPNEVCVESRTMNAGSAFILVMYSVVGLWRNDLYVPAKYGRGVHLHDSSAWLFFGAVSAASVVLCLPIIDHHDKRDNERYYKLLARGGSLVGWTLFVLALVWQFTSGEPFG